MARPPGMLAVALALGGCQAVTDFSLTPVAETSNALCTDGRDNDFDGLSDCQDWNCLGMLACCDIPEVLLVDDFEGGPADCNAPECTDADCTTLTCGPDPANWYTWPCPFTKVCGGQLRIDKSECYVAGAITQLGLDLDPGLRVEADLAGRPERLGFLEVSLTLQTPDSFPISLNPCGVEALVTGFVGVRQVWDESGWRAQARVHGEVIERSPAVSGDVEHTVAIVIDPDRRINYELDGEVFAVAPEPIPDGPEEARVVIHGLTEQAAAAAVRVQAGRRCHDPLAWTPAAADIEAAEVLAGDPSNGLVFDRDEVYHPMMMERGGELELYYTGCYWRDGAQECEPFDLGVGRAIAGADGFAREAGNPLLTPEDFPEVGFTGLHAEMTVDLLAGEPLRGFAAPAADQGIFWADADLQPLDWALAPAPVGAWDERDLCCPTAVQMPDGAIHLWYAARRPLENDSWQIGLATAADGVTFVRHPDNPVLPPGPAGAFDSASTHSPKVVHDAQRGLFRMWYVGSDFFGKKSIGYAVSIDGVTWSRYPGNPVIAPDDVGLVSIGGPEVWLGADGRLRGWFHGSTVEEPRRRIFELTNQGSLIAPPE